MGLYEFVNEPIQTTTSSCENAEYPGAEPEREWRSDPVIRSALLAAIPAGFTE
jgi:hypothetical protein